MKKLFVILGICMVFLLAGGVFAENVTVSDNVETFVKEVAKEKGIMQKDIKSVKEVDFNDLPEEVKIGNIDDTNLALYEVDHGEERPTFVITVSDTKFKKTVEEFVNKVANKMILNFGHGGVVDNSLFLETATGIQTSEEKGYVMMRSGSITGLSTNLEVLEANEIGEVEIIIYKNSEPTGFRNGFLVDSTGIAKDYDTLSANTITFEAGDVISVYVEVDGTISVQDVITIMEISIFE